MRLLFLLLFIWHFPHYLIKKELDVSTLWFPELQSPCLPQRNGFSQGQLPLLHDQWVIISPLVG